MRPGRAWLLVAAAVTGACGGGNARSPSGEAPRRVALQRGDIIDRQLLTGEIRALNPLTLTVPRAEGFGQLTVRWFADEGSVVKAGDKVLEFDNSVFAQQLAAKHLAMLEAEMTMRSAHDLGAVAIAGKETQLRQHQIALEKATVRAGVPEDLLSGREFQERQLAKKRAEVAVDKAMQELAAERTEAALQEQVKQIELDKSRRSIAAAEAAIADLAVTAPRAGVVVVEDHPWLGRKIQVGDLAVPGMVVLTLPAPDEAMGVRAELSDVDDGRVTVGMAGTCVLDAYPGDVAPCKVASVTPVARMKGEGLRRMFAVELALERTDARMKPGMSVKIELHPRSARGAVIVPRGAIVAQPGADRRARVRMASGELRDVTLGLCDAQGCAAESGVTAGEVVGIGGAS